VKAGQVIGKRMGEIIAEGLIDQSVTLEVFKAQTSITMIQRLKDGNQILVTGSPIFDEQGEIYLVVVNERDISELDSLRNELEESRSLAQTYRNELSRIDLKKISFRTWLLEMRKCSRF